MMIIMNMMITKMEHKYTKFKIRAQTWKQWYMYCWTSTRRCGSPYKAQCVLDASVNKAA